MELQTFNYTQEKGWSVNAFPALDSPQTLVILFGAKEYVDNQKPIAKLIKAFPQSIFVGCSTAGEILGSVIQDATISVAVMKFKQTILKSFSTEIKSMDDSFSTGTQLAEHLNKDNLRGIFILSEGLNINASQLIKGLNAALPNHVVVTGGLAGDGDRFKQTWVISDKQLKSNYVTAVGFYGDKIRIGHGSRGGWDSFGPERVITNSKDNVLYELDHKPALALYKEYLGEEGTKQLPASGLLFPLAIRENTEDKREIVRTILGVDEKTQSMIFAGDVPTGYLAKLMRANFENLIEGANIAALDSKKNQTESPILAVAISCVGRRLLLKEYTEEETEATLQSFPLGTQQIGFYSYGEISPYTTGHCDLHNQTMTMTTFSEEQ
ncbi:MAG: hypothetical protein COY58_05095 [Gammaproteobacteria bacterium CG_4_10_14_0_8_um_filter_38_16]|nr:MAG: hypothetical protein COY58_05095 [Gammaproteobacteria bacterium CG_4_10_14_0_8_um_filter_38_16]PJA02814.1 MAG: hypothetical protein COX72_08480 [Gammaproteobacteria bacterium CG_4_10_14_0_2_um_filter_38_22]PJB09662.1 MAG: hypothetical protein CO120_08890 [Gammaproteobacteria bacterium CG_4_9_14_3_um_filter_38_9]